VTVVSAVLTSTGSALGCADGAVAGVDPAAVSTGAAFVVVDSVGTAGSPLVFGCLAGRAFGAAAASCPGDVRASAVRALLSAVAAFFAAVPAALPLAVVDAEVASGLASADLARAGADAVLLGRDSSTGADASPFSAVTALAAVVRVEAVRAGFVASSVVLAGVDRDRAAFAGEAVAASVVSAAEDLRAAPLAEGVAADALAGAVERPAGAVLDVAGRVGGVAPVDLPVESVRLVAGAFRGRVWFAATVTR
jgi:hypothetical protein